MDESNNSIFLIVKDTGLGIRKNDLLNLNEMEDKPIQLNLDYNYNQMGTGIGIGISNDILKKLDHKLIIDSVYGEGTSVTVVINNIRKRSEESLQYEEQITLNENILGSKSQLQAIDNFLDLNNSPKNIKKSIFEEKEFYYSRNLISNLSLVSLNNTKNMILVVDDSKTLIKAVIKLLRTNKFFNDNFRTIEGSDGIDILKYLMDDQINGSRIKLVITDENMEYLCGSSAISIIRDLQLHNKMKDIFIVSLTAFIDEENISNIMKKGADLVLSKPLNLNQIESIMTNYTNSLLLNNNNIKLIKLILY